jgi:hypothetical protein
MKLRADRRDERRSEASVRNEAWRKLNREEQIASLKERPGKSLKQLKKLGAEVR